MKILEIGKTNSISLFDKRPQRVIEQQKYKKKIFKRIPT